MAQFASNLVQRIVDVFHKKSSGLVLKPPGDIYAVGFLIEVQEMPVLIATANSEVSCRRACPRASSPQEARWNYAFWKQKPIIDVFADDIGCDLIERWVAQFGEDADEDLVFRNFGDLVVKAAMELHSDGTIQNVFGRPIPIIFHDLEGRDEMFEWTRIANPEHLADDYLNCNGGFS